MLLYRQLINTLQQTTSNIHYVPRGLVLHHGRGHGNWTVVKLSLPNASLVSVGVLNSCHLVSRRNLLGVSGEKSNLTRASLRALTM